jgi:hypothetical protein
MYSDSTQKRCDKLPNIPQRIKQNYLPNKITF